MTHTTKYISVGAVSIMIALTAFAIYSTAKANPSFFIRANSTTCGSLTATTSVVYMTAGTATTSATMDTGCTAAGSVDSAMLMIQFAGSSTASVLNIDIQYSQDNVDWYATNLAWNADVGVSTSSPSIGAVTQYTFTFASSTISSSNGRIALTNANSATSTRIIKVPTPTRYVRAVYSLATGSAGGAVWSEFVAKRQSN